MHGDRFLLKPRVGGWLVAGYLIALVVVEAIGDLPGVDLRHAWAASPARVLAGQWWTLASSGLVVDRIDFVQLVLLAILATYLTARHGARVFWGAAIGGHICATLIAYLGLRVLWVTGEKAYAHAATKPDFGISSVWIAVLASLVADRMLALWGSHRRAGWLATAGAWAVGTVGSLIFIGDLATVEHVLAASFGGLALLLAVCRDVWARHAPCSASGAPCSADSRLGPHLVATGTATIGDDDVFGLIDSGRR